MSAQEIIAELAKLQPEELRLVRAEVEALSGEMNLPTRPDDFTPAAALVAQEKKSVSAFLLEMAASANGLPLDLAENHDHYLYGVPKRGIQR